MSTFIVIILQNCIRVSIGHSCRVYEIYCAVYLKIDYTLRCLKYICYICSVSSPLIDHGLSLHPHT